VAVQRSRRDVADVATAAKRLELRIAELDRQGGEPGKPGSQAPRFGQGGMSGQGDTTEQLAELRRQLADLQARQERLPRPASG
jgi:phage shock protein A